MQVKMGKMVLNRLDVSLLRRAGDGLVLIRVLSLHVPDPDRHRVLRAESISYMVTEWTFQP